MSFCKNHPLVAALGLALLATTVTAASAADMPKRKAGLWEIKSQMEGMPSAPSMQMCVDQATDNLLQERAKEKPNCSTMDFKTSGNRSTLHAVCKMDNSTVTMDGVYTGNFETGYKSDMKMQYNPPVHGMSTMRMTQEAKWLGPCKAGQKPGDVIMSNMPGHMGSVNVNEMMNDPRIKEMMKRQKVSGQ